MRGRKPAEQVVVPMAPDGIPQANLQERALARAAELRPEGLSLQVSWVWNRLAPALCHPTRNRLDEVNRHLFVMLCKSVARFEAYETALAEMGETYETHGRQGKQLKSRPEVAQMNECWRQIRALASDFGMSPAAERSLARPGQLGFDFGTGEGANDFT